MTDRPARVAIVGTFDVANLGDLLFPLLARHELEQRLGDVALIPYSYRAMGPPAWPFEVRSLGALPGDLAQTDLLLVGGGDLIRADAALAPGYAPADSDVHHPLGTWLVPTLLAGAAGVPVAWNAVGVRPGLPDWTSPLLAAAAGCVSYLAVRDEASASRLLAGAPAATPRIVPDSAFAVGTLVGERERDAARELLDSVGLGAREYVVVQPALALTHVRAELLTALDAARAAGLAVLELPIGPVHGDGAAALDLPGAVVRLERWPAPLVLAALIAGSQGVLAESLHAAVVALAHGVPVLRPQAAQQSKHTLLDQLAGVHGLAEPVFGAGPPGPQVAAAVAQLSAHWDAIAACTTESRQSAPAALRLVAELPRRFEQAAAGAQLAIEQRERSAELEAGYEAFRERSAELSVALREGAAQRQQLEARLAHADAELSSMHAELKHLVERDRTLQRIHAGGWWRLRGRLRLPLRVAGLARGAMRAR